MKNLILAALILSTVATLAHAETNPTLPSILAEISYIGTVIGTDKEAIKTDKDLNRNLLNIKKEIKNLESDLSTQHDLAQKERIRNRKEALANFFKGSNNIEVNYYQPQWDCGPCKMGSVTMEASVESLNKNYRSDNFNLNIISLSDEELRAKGIKSVPATEIVNTDKNLRILQVGAKTAKQIIEAIADVSNKKYNYDKKEHANQVIHLEEKIELNQRDLVVLNDLENIEKDSNLLASCTKILKNKGFSLTGQNLYITCSSFSKENLSPLFCLMRNEIHFSESKRDYKNEISTSLGSLLSCYDLSDEDAASIKAQRMSALKEEFGIQK